MAAVMTTIGKVVSSSAFGAGLSAVGGIISGIGSLTNAKQEVQVGEFNSEIYEQRAAAQRASGKLLEEQQRRMLKSDIGTQVSLFAKSGIQMGGSALDVIMDSLTNAEMSISIDKYNNEVAARGYETEGALEKYKAGERARLQTASASKSFLSTAADMFKNTIGDDNGQTLGSGTTSYGIKVPSRYVPPGGSGTTAPSGGGGYGYAFR